MKGKKVISILLTANILLSMAITAPHSVQSAPNSPVVATQLSVLPNSAYVEPITSAYTLGDGPEIEHNNWYQASYSSTDRLYSMSTGASNTIGDGYAVKIQKDNNNAYLMIDATNCNNIVANYWLKDATNPNDISEVIEVSYDGGLNYQPLPDKNYSSSKIRTHRLNGADNNANVRFRINGGLRAGHILWFDNLSIYSDTTAPTWNNATITASIVTDTSMRLNWSGAIDNTNTHESGIKYYKIYNEDSLVATVTDDVYYDITGLKQNTLYTFTVKAGDVAGNWSSEGITGTYTTSAIADITPPVWISNSINVTNKGQKSLTLAWSGAQDDTAVAGYKVYKDNVLLETVSSDVYSYDVNNLIPGTIYNFRIEAEDTIGNLTSNGPSSVVTTLNTGSSMLIEDFEGANPLDIWTLSQSGGTVNVVDDPMGVNGKSLEIQDISATNSAAARYSFGQKSGVVTVEYKFLHKSVIKTMYLPVYGRTAAGVDREFFRFSTASGNMLTYGNETNGYTNIGLISPDQWYYAKVVVDTNNMVFMFSVRGDDGTTYVSAKNNLYGITSSPYIPKSINQIGFYTKSTDTALLYIDDVKIYDTDMSLDMPEWPTQSSFAASEIGKKEMTLTWSTPNDYLGIKKYIISKDNAPAGSVDGSLNTYKVSGLEPGTSYMFKVEAEDSAGNRSINALELQHSTMPKDEIEPPVWPEGSTLTASDIDVKTLKLTWTPAVDNTGVTAYRINKSGSIIDTVGGDIISYEVTGLEANTQYDFSIQAGDASDNWSAEALSLAVSTIGDVKPPVWSSPYFGLERETSTSGLLSFSWRGAIDNVGVTQYRIYEGENLLTTTNTALVTLTGLIPGEKHTFTVWAGDAAGNWSTDNPKVTFRTFDNTLPIWQSGSLSGSDTTASSLTLNWNGALDNGMITEYRIYRDGIIDGVVSGDVHSYVMKGLLHDTQYVFTVQAVDALNNESKDGPSATLATPHSEDITTPVWSSGVLNANDIMTHSLKLQWSGADDDTSVAGYRIYNGNMLLDTVYGNQSTYDVTDLAPGMEYIFTVQACDEAGNWSIDGPSVSVITPLVVGDTKYVTTIDELNNAISGANPGDIIILNDGIYESGNIASVKDKHGLPNARIVIKAANPGMAEIKAVTGFEFINCSYINVEGIKFSGKQTILVKQAAIDMLGCNNMRITRCHFILDETQAQNEAGFSMAWVTIKSSDGVVSHHNHVDRNLFEKKLAPGVILSIDGDWEAQQISQYDVIEYNHFRDTKPRIDNGKESIRYGTSFNSQSRAFGLVQYNLFEECDGDPEFLSVKSSDVTVRYNTFLNSMGQLTYRHGDRITAYGNFFIGDGKKSGVGGIRMYGTDHKVFGNYFYGLTAPTLQIDGGDSYFNGRLTDKWTVRRTEVSFNTIVDCSTGITIWGGRQYAPQDITIGNNLVMNSGGISYTTSSAAEPGIPTPRPVYAGNIAYPTLYPASKKIVEVNDPISEQEIRLIDPVLAVSESVYRLSSASPAIDASIGNYIYMIEDIDGQPRTGLKDVGADEYSDTSIVRKPLTGSDVGFNSPVDNPSWKSGSLIASHVKETSMKLSWSGAVDDKKITMYRVYNGNTQVSTVTGNVYSCTINNLTPDTNYVFTVQAGDEDGNWTTEGTSITVKTLKSSDTDEDEGNGIGNENPGNPKEENEAIKVMVNSKTGEGTVIISKDIIENAFGKAKPDEDGNLILELEIPKAPGVSAYIAALDAEAVKSCSELRKIELKTVLGTITLPENMLGTWGLAGAKNVEIKMAEKNTTELSAELKEQVGGRPVIELSIKVDGMLIEDYNPGAPLMVSFPYKPNEEEFVNYEYITVWHVDYNGNTAPVFTARYNPTKKMVSFTAERSGNYAVVYIKKTFEDINEYDWAKMQIEVLASKGIINGKSDEVFDPGANITRADFTILLVKALGLSAKVDNNFNDIQPNDYYYKAVGIAKAIGLANGTGNSVFNPNEEISRQDMITIVARALIYVNKLKASVGSSDIDNFADSKDVSPYAVESIDLLIKEGLIQGSDGLINPLGNASRQRQLSLCIEFIKNNGLL